MFLKEIWGSGDLVFDGRDVETSCRELRIVLCTTWYISNTTLTFCGWPSWSWWCLVVRANPREGSCVYFHEVWLLEDQCKVVLPHLVSGTAHFAQVGESCYFRTHHPRFLERSVWPCTVLPRHTFGDLPRFTRLSIRLLCCDHLSWKNYEHVLLASVLKTFVVLCISGDSRGINNLVGLPLRAVWHRFSVVILGSHLSFCNLLLRFVFI